MGKGKNLGHENTEKLCNHYRIKYLQCGLKIKMNKIIRIYHDRDQITSGDQIDDQIPTATKM